MLATLRPLAAGSARRNFSLAPQAASRNPPQIPVRGMTACPRLSRRRIGASIHLRGAALDIARDVSFEDVDRPVRGVHPEGPLDGICTPAGFAEENAEGGDLPAGEVPDLGDDVGGAGLPGDPDPRDRQALRPPSGPRQPPLPLPAPEPVRPAGGA